MKMKYIGAAVEYVGFFYRKQDFCHFCCISCIINSPGFIIYKYTVYYMIREA